LRSLTLLLERSSSSVSLPSIPAFRTHSSEELT
jgi:hypothetical protein